MALTHTDVRVMGYEDPAVEGESVTFTCFSGSVLNGPRSSMCMGNGEWEPDPGEVNCTGVTITTGTPTVLCMPLKFIIAIDLAVYIHNYLSDHS